MKKKLLFYTMILFGLLLNPILFSNTLSAQNQAKTLRFEANKKKITFNKNGFPLDYHSVAKVRWQHMQDILRLPDYNGKKYYLGTYSQNCSNNEGGMVFVGELGSGTSGKIIWIDELNNKHSSGGFNHPGDIRMIENVVLIAGQNWNGDGIGKVGTVIGDTFDKCYGDNQAILFYDVSNPSKPKYMGKVEAYYQNNSSKKFSSDISSLQVVKRDDGYHIWVNGIEGDLGLRLYSKTLSPDAKWEWEKNASVISASTVYFNHPNGDSGYAITQVNDDGDGKWLKYGSNIGKAYYERVPETSFGDGTTLNVTTQKNGRSYLIYGNVESDSKIEIEEVESEKYSGPITDLYLMVDNKRNSKPGYEEIPYDLNKNAEGDDIFLYYTRDPSKGQPITDIKVVFDDRDNLSGYQVIRNNKSSYHYDLNSHAGGKDIFMGFKRGGNSAPITSIDIINRDDSNMNGKDGWKKIDKDLNDGAGGDDIFLIYTRNKISTPPIEKPSLLKDGELISLKADNGKYVSARINDENKVIASAPKVGNWEIFKIEDLGDGKIALKADNGKYVSARMNDSNKVIANAPRIDKWEKFKLEKQ